MIAHAQDIRFSWIHSYVKFNGLWNSPREIDVRLSRHCGDLFSIYSLNVVSVVGPCALLRFGDYFYAVCTKHQLLGRDPAWIGLNHAHDQTITTSGALLTVSEDFSETNSIGDIAIFDFTLPARSGSIDNQVFLDISSGACVFHGDDLLGLRMFGLLDVDQEVEVESSDIFPDGYRTASIKSRLRPIMAKYFGAGSDTSDFRFEVCNPEVRGYRGLSGGPIFAMKSDGRYNFSAVFAGIVTQASGNFGYGIRGDIIRAIIKNLCARY